ncbi:MAG: hypothetical protein NC235_15445 [Clostridiales bacterium]|nr:hypothetical protein [Alistipes senegalensis]MCM1363261.1 hypothetical protein [Clostridiales bacterium]
MVKKFASLLCAIVLSTSFIVGNAASAAVILPDSPAYSYASNCSSNLSISGTTATCKSSVIGYYDKTTKIVITQTLQKKNSSGNWDDVCSWNDTIYSFKGSLTNTKSSLSSGTYRLKTVATVYAGTEHETITKYST